MGYPAGKPRCTAKVTRAGFAHEQTWCGKLGVTWLEDGARCADHAVKPDPTGICTSQRHEDCAHG